MRKILNIFLLLIALGILGFLPTLAQVLTADDGVTGNSGFSFVWVMFPAWIYLGGALTMLVLALKFMNGGSLSKPFTLMGAGVLVDSIAQIFYSLIIIGLISDSGLSNQIIFFISLASRFSIVLGMIWIANIFGVLRNQ